MTGVPFHGASIRSGIKVPDLLLSVMNQSS
jgi:hypothetical protein